MNGLMIWLTLNPMLGSLLCLREMFEHTGFFYPLVIIGIATIIGVLLRKP